MSFESYEEIVSFFKDNGLNDAVYYIDSLFSMMELATFSYNLVNEEYVKLTGSKDHENKQNLEASLESGEKNTDFTAILVQPAISGHEISDTVFVKKAVFDFIHYARMSLDALAQVINQTVLYGFYLGDKEVSWKGVVKRLGAKGFTTPLFEHTKKMQKEESFNYLCALDNKIKHNCAAGLNLLYIDNDAFMIAPFRVLYYKIKRDQEGKIKSKTLKCRPFKDYNAVQKLEEIETFVNQQIFETLAIIKQIIENEGQQDAGQ